MEKRLLKKLEGFTLIEMMIVLLIISVLILLFVPNLSKYKAQVDEKSAAAITQLVDTQIELYELQNNGKTPTLEELLDAGYIKQEQLEIYEENNK
ncbi:MAG: competence type IV pilus major pilin ComGC [Enterococcus sp.]